MNPVTVIEETLSPEADTLDAQDTQQEPLDVQPTDEPADELTTPSDAAAEQTSAALLQEHLDYIGRLIGLRQQVVQCERNVEDRKEELKAAKEELDLAHKAIGSENAKREILYFSPHCLNNKKNEMPLFALENA